MTTPSKAPQSSTSRVESQSDRFEPHQIAPDAWYATNIAKREYAMNNTGYTFRTREAAQQACNSANAYQLKQAGITRTIAEAEEPIRKAIAEAVCPQCLQYMVESGQLRASDVPEWYEP